MYNNLQRCITKTNCFSHKRDTNSIKRVDLVYSNLGCFDFNTSRSEDPVIPDKNLANIKNRDGDEPNGLVDGHRTQF